MEKANNANEMSNEVKKFTLKNVEDFLSDNEMKHTRGGSTSVHKMCCDHNVNSPTFGQCVTDYVCPSTPKCVSLYGEGSVCE